MIMILVINRSRRKDSNLFSIRFRHMGKSQRKLSRKLNFTLRTVCYFCFRDFLEKGIVDFAERNPSVAVYVNEKKGEHPVLEAKYCKFECPGSDYINKLVSFSRSIIFNFLDVNKYSRVFFHI